MKNKTEGVAGSADGREDLATINIGNINRGAAVDQFDLALDKVLANIADLSTKATASRKITLEVVFKPHSDRIKIETEVHVSAKLATCEASKFEIDQRWQLDTVNAIASWLSANVSGIPIIA